MPGESLKERYGKETLVDVEAGERFRYVESVGVEMFKGSGLVDPQKEITREDIELIDQFHETVSPVNPDKPWRLDPADRDTARGEIADRSFFRNWNSAGGPREHIHLAIRAAEIIARELKANVKHSGEEKPEYASQAIEELNGLNPLLVSAAAALHDDGRLITHLQGNDKIRDTLLKKIGVRKDIMECSFDDGMVLTTPEDASMDTVVQNLTIKQIILKIADEFGRRSAADNTHTMSLAEYNTGSQEEWAARYLSRPESGRRTEQIPRDNMALFVRNTNRFFLVLKRYIEEVSTINIEYLVEKLEAELSPLLEVKS